MMSNFFNTVWLDIRYAVILRPLPYQEPERLVRIYTEFHSKSPLLKFWMSQPEYDDLRKGSRARRHATARSPSAMPSVRIAGG